MTKRQKIWDVLFPFVAILVSMAFCSVIVLLIIGLLTGLYDPVDIYQEVKATPLLVSCAFYLVTILTQYRTFRMDELRFGSEQNLWTIGQSVVAAVVLIACGTGLNVVLTHSALSGIFRGYAQDSAAAFQGQNLFLLLLATVILGPVAEEMIFRGMVFRRARAHCGRIPAMLISAFLFGIYHGNMMQLLYGLLIGAALAWMYERSKSLRLTVLTHMGLNLVAIVISSFL